MRKRRLSDLRRSYLRALQRVPADAAVAEAVKLREYAIARKFFAYASIEALNKCDDIGGAPWPQWRIEAAIRKNAKAHR